MIFITESGSEYEVNHETKCIRRVSGTHDPTPLQGKDGEWRSYNRAFIELEERALIMWGGGKGTITTKVVSILEDKCTIL